MKKNIYEFSSMFALWNLFKKTALFERYICNGGIFISFLQSLIIFSLSISHLCHSYMPTLIPVCEKLTQ